MSELPAFWTQVKLDPDLAKLIVLTEDDIAYYTLLATHAADPAAWLSKELTKRGQRANDLKLARKIERKAQDAQRIGHPGAWPAPRLPLKTQPWQNEDGKSMRFAYVRNTDYLIVHTDDGETIVYDTIEELVEMWSVD